MSAYLLIVSTKPPYHSSAAVDAFEAALAATNVGLEVKILFLHDGVYQLIDTQYPQAIGHKNIYKKIMSLPLFDVEDIYVDTASMDARSLCITNVDIHWQPICENKKITLMQCAQQILVF